VPCVWRGLLRWTFENSVAMVNGQPNVMSHVLVLDYDSDGLKVKVGVFGNLQPDTEVVEACPPYSTMA